jgi:putative peptide zinc metalloprotease protein
MSTPADALAVPHARRDLELAPVEYRGQAYWTIKDPIASRYFQLREEERFILGLLDGRLSLDEIIVRFEHRFAPRRLKRTELAGFLALLHREGLVAASAAGQGDHLLERERSRSRRAWLERLGNVLAIRLPGINPNRALTAALPWLAWLFSPVCQCVAVALIVAALAVVAVNFGVLVERLPRFGEFFGPGNWLWLAASLALVKTLHELGHAVTCKRFGGEVNRLGIMLLVFTPALYCDVSDAWMLRDKWRRIAVSAAGVAVELVLAAAATLVWSLTQPGWLNSLALNVMFVCSVGTLLINGNPLLRYDGYYVLADWLETPNLQQQASAAVRRGLAWLCAGVRLDPPRLIAAPGPVVLWTYAVLSLVYKGIVIVGILWLVDAALRPLGLGAVSVLIATMVLVSLAASPIARAANFLTRPHSRRQLDWRRLAAALLVLAALLVVAAIVPLPARVRAPVIMRPAGGRQVFVTTPGSLAEIARAGDEVAAGQLLARLVNRQLELDVADLVSRQAQQRLHLAHLALRQHREPELADQLPAAEARLADLTRQLSDKRRELARLTLVAPIAGTVLPPPPRPLESSADRLATYAGTPHEPQNLGCYLAAGTLLCTVADPSRLEAAAIVEQADLATIREGQDVTLTLQVLPGISLSGRVRQVSRLKSDELPPQLLAARMVPLRMGPDGRAEPVHTYYEAIIVPDPHAQPLLVGATGWANIAVDPMPLWLRAYRGLRGTLRTPW